MSTTVDFSFPWGRYHATAWDRNANEGRPDWPPAPWRILRALYASSQWHCPDLDQGLVEGLLAKLSDAPRYRLPRFAIAHTRHYYPGADHRAGVKTDTTKTFDVFIVTERGAILTVDWPGDLTLAEREALGQVLDGLAYLGRADSLVDARLWPHEQVLPNDGWTSPDDGSESREMQPLLTPSKPLDINNLTTTAITLRSRRLRQPPGTQWTHYEVPRPTPVERSVATAKSMAEFEPDIAVRFSYTGRPIRKFEAVALGDTLRRACLSEFGGQSTEVEWQLAGKNPDGTPTSEPHRHAHFLAYGATLNTKVIDTMVVWIPAGLSSRALDAVARTRQLHSAAINRPWLGKRQAIYVPMIAVEAIGPVAAVAPELCGPSRTWHSVTPFGITRHTRHIDDTFIAENVLRELSLRDWPNGAPAVRVFKGDALSYRRSRPNHGKPRRAFKLQLTFAEPVPGPIALGHLSHFGLGLFMPGQALD